PWSCPRSNLPSALKALRKAGRFRSEAAGWSGKDDPARSAFSCPEDGIFTATSEASEANVAKTSPIEFFNQVKTEVRKVVWPTKRETMMTTVMVLIMTGLLGIFFFGIDSLFGWIVKILLSLATGQG